MSWQAGTDVNIINKSGKTVLTRAAAKGHVECLKELIAAGASINKEDNDGETALIGAAIQDGIECLKELIDAGKK